MAEAAPADKKRRTRNTEPARVVKKRRETKKFIAPAEDKRVEEEEQIKEEEVVKIEDGEEESYTVPEVVPLAQCVDDDVIQDFTDEKVPELKEEETESEIQPFKEEVISNGKHHKKKISVVCVAYIVSVSDTKPVMMKEEFFAVSKNASADPITISLGAEYLTSHLMKHKRHIAGYTKLAAGITGTTKSHFHWRLGVTMRDLSMILVDRTKCGFHVLDTYGRFAFDYTIFTPWEKVHYPPSEGKQEWDRDPESNAIYYANVSFVFDGGVTLVFFSAPDEETARYLLKACVVRLAKMPSSKPLPPNALADIQITNLDSCLQERSDDYSFHHEVMK